MTAEGAALVYRALDLHLDGPGHLVGPATQVADLPNVFGGQLLAQIVVAAQLLAPDKTVKSLHTVFVRRVEVGPPLDFEVDVMHAGRLFASATVSVTQHERLCCRALVLLDEAGEELAAHAVEAPAVPPPDACERRFSLGPAEFRLATDVDLDALGASGPPEIRVWARFPDAPGGDAISRGLLAYATEPHFFGASLLPHDGLSQAQAADRLLAGVLTHTVTFHAAPPAAEWVLLDVSSPHLGRGRIYGQATVFSQDGTFLASASQENQLRPRRS